MNYTLSPYDEALRLVSMQLLVLSCTKVGRDHFQFQFVFVALFFGGSFRSIRTTLQASITRFQIMLNTDNLADVCP